MRKSQYSWKECVFFNESVALMLSLAFYSLAFVAHLVGVCGIGIIWVLELFAYVIRQLIRSIQSPHEACIMLPSQTAPQAKRQRETLLVAHAQDITATNQIEEVSSDMHA